MNFFDLILSLQGYPLRKAKLRYHELNCEFELNPEGFRSRYAWEIFNYHVKCNNFYKDYVGSSIHTEWSSIPILTKLDFQRPLKKLLSSEYSLDKVYVSNTSGSSGHPFFFAKDKFAHALAWANIAFQYHKVGLTTRSRQARFYGIPLSTKGYYKERIKDFIANRVRFPVFDLQDSVMETWIRRLDNTDVQQLNGYTSSLLAFSKFCVRKGIVLRNVCPQLKVCIVTSEVCTPEDRLIMQIGFGVPVVNEYGASELGIIAFDSACDQWPICEELILVEIVDQENKPVPDGHQGRVICTSLFNKAFPIIRYEIGDLATIITIDGRRHLIRLECRTNDMAKLPSGKLSPGLTFYYISKSILEKTGEINEFIIRQVDARTFRFIINAKSRLSVEDESLIKEKMDLYLEPGLNLELEYVNAIQRPLSGKIKHFYCEV